MTSSESISYLDLPKFGVEVSTSFKSYDVNLRSRDCCVAPARSARGQSRLSMAGLQGVPGASADPPIPDAVAAAARRVALCQKETRAAQQNAWTEPRH
jgi:hypothetical protein